MIVTRSLFVALILLGTRVACSETLLQADFARGDLAELGWQADGAWDLFEDHRIQKSPGRMARFAANRPAGTLTHTFTSVRNPARLTLDLDYGWGWGDAAQGADSIAFQLLNAEGSGYAFKIHRTRARWAVQWGRAVKGQPPREMTWAARDIDATWRSIRDGGGLTRVTLSRDSDGTWTLSNRDWDGGHGAAVRFIDTTTSEFDRLVLLGTQNFDEQLFGRMSLAVADRSPRPITAVPTASFLDSIGVCTTFPDRGQPLDRTVSMVRYGGFRWVRGGIEGLTENGPTTLATYLDLHQQTGVRFSWGLVSGGSDLKKLLTTARPLADAGALLAFEGNNEPNNWGVTYEGEAGGGQAPSWHAVARLQRDLAAAVAADPVLKVYPVWSLSEAGGQSDNMGLQFLTIPEGADTRMPTGTRYADAANVHNYIYHPSSPHPEDNKSWNAADPTSTCRIDGLFGNHGITWAKRFRGYSDTELQKLPRVTTETGCTIEGEITEDLQARHLLSLYLAQFKRGWSHTAVYLLRDRTDEAGNQTFGFFQPDYRPRLAATYLHQLTTLLADPGRQTAAGQLSYSIPEHPSTLHDLLLQHSRGTFQLVLWNERLKGTDRITLQFETPQSSISVFDPTRGLTPVSEAKNVSTLELTLGHHPLILMIPAP